MWSPNSTRTKQPHTPDRREDDTRPGAQEMAFCPHALKAAKKRRTPSAHGENSSEKNDGVDADAALAGPVGIRFEVEPEGKLVQRKRRADAITYGHEPAEEDGKRRMRPAEVEQPPVTNEQ